jgi:KDO2-lipid IV(A) lauroyltransferase
MSNKINTKLKLTGREVYDHCKSLNKGMIFLTAHIGNWDTGSMLFSAEEDMKLNIIRKKEDDNEVQNFIHSLRYKSAKDKVNVIYVSDDAFSSIEIVNVLKKNEIVFIQGDRSYSGMKTIKIDFCGSEVEAPVGPYVIAWVSGAPIIPVFSLRIGFMKYEIRLTQPVYVDKSLGKEKAIDEVAKKVFGKIEEITKEFPHQWFCFYPYWDDKSKTEKKKVNTDKMKAVS